ncbi:MAG: hypothetical protein MK221_00180 [Gemmatimonadetes bacterium]|jgi:hypothetical protein|nr:hypothetical protein [Gemmatimonadota bacterium]
MEESRNTILLIVFAVACGLLAFQSTPLILFIEGEQAQGFSYWCSRNAWIQLTPDVPQLELGSSVHPGCRRDTPMALIRFALVSLPVFMLGKMYLKKK